MLSVPVFCAKHFFHCVKRQNQCTKSVDVDYYILYYGLLNA